MLFPTTFIFWLLVYQTYTIYIFEILQHFRNRLFWVARILSLLSDGFCFSVSTTFIYMYFPFISVRNMRNRFFWVPLIPGLLQQVIWGCSDTYHAQRVLSNCSHAQNVQWIFLGYFDTRQGLWIFTSFLIPIFSLQIILDYSHT